MQTKSNMDRNTANLEVRSLDSGELPALLRVDDLAKLLNCSARSVYRLADTGGIPLPVRIGGMIRWPRNAIEEWIAQGCPENP